MGKKMREKDGHKRENEQVEEGSASKKQRDFLDASTGDINDVSRSINVDEEKKKKKDSCEKKDQMKKRKTVVHTDEKESRKAQKKYKKSKDGVGVKEASTEPCTDGNSEKKKDQIKKRKTVFDADEKESRKALKKHKKSKDGVEVKEASTETCTAGKQKEESSQERDMGNTSDLEAKRVGKGKKKNMKRDVFDEVTTATETLKQGVNVDADNAEVGNRGSKESSKSVKSYTEGKHSKGDARTRKSVNSTNQSENARPKEKPKRVSFSDHLEVFPSEDVTDGNKDVSDVNEDGKEGLVLGRRYSKEEDVILMDAVASYIESHNLGDDGINMVMNCKSYPEVRNCWKEIQEAIPWRPKDSVYHRAHVLFERDEKRPWTPDEYQLIQKYVEKHGTKWKMLADALGKHRHHVKDTWRRIRKTNKNEGRWSQEECQNLFDLVNLDLSMKVFEEKKSKHGMYRDNIPWTAIGDRMETRDFITCCKKWYQNLQSPMVKEGIWADTDDYLLLDALFNLDACCMEDVDWDDLIEHRSGDLCRKRWNQMVRHIGPHADKGFAEQVEVLSKRYRPDMLDARVTYDSKQPVDLP